MHTPFHVATRPPSTPQLVCLPESFLSVAYHESLSNSIQEIPQ